MRYRGYSATDQKDASTPERPRYRLAGTAPRWRDLEGYHTRFGDVRELLARVDDRYVIMNAGDELALRFPEAPPAGGFRSDSRLHHGRRRLGEGRRLQHRVLAHGAAAADARVGTLDGPAGRLEDDPVFRAHRGTSRCTIRGTSRRTAPATRLRRECRPRPP